MIGFIFFARFRYVLTIVVYLVLLLAVPTQASGSGGILNVLFIGADKENLMMTAIYHIDLNTGKEDLNSEAVFFPSASIVPWDPSKSLGEIFKEGDARGLLKSLEKTLEIDIAYYIRVERQALKEAEGFIDPITVAGETIPLEELFTMAVGPHDREILGQLMDRFTRPQVYFFHLPKLVFSPQKLVQTDFPPTAGNLWLHFQIATRVDTGNIKKTVVTSSPLNSDCWRMGG